MDQRHLAFGRFRRQKLHAAPMELANLITVGSYKHLAPTEP
jgi:hypothetical protein